jgi:Fe-S-cluster containining protein
MFSVVRRLWGRVVSLSGGGSLERKARHVIGVYRSLDKSSAELRRGSALKCPPGCGKCCQNSVVEATELEMLPLALRLSETGQADEFYRRAEAQKFEGLCVFFDVDNGRGKCRQYAFRPLVCRLFGFAGNRDKHGQPRLVTCAVLKKNQPEAAEHLLEQVAGGRLKPPMMADAVMRLSSVDPSMARESYPVNKAFSKALERVELNKKFMQKG